MTSTSDPPTPNAFVRFVRNIYHPLGFKKGYNFILFFILAGALIGFVLARFQYLAIDTVYRDAVTSSGEWYYYSQSFYRTGILLHLACVLPAGILAPLQFVPIIRYKLLLFHRLNGYVALLLLLGGNIGALMITRHAFGGSLATQGAAGTAALATTSAAVLAYINIKRQQIDQHRAWMIRTWVWAGFIITLRIIQILSALAISEMEDFYEPILCPQLASTGANVSAYPACVADPANGYAAVRASFTQANGPENVAAAVRMSFGMAGWIALTLHVLGTELYLNLTPREAERLRKLSYERQLERGFAHPGNAGTTVQRLGDAKEWKVPGADKAPEAS